MVKEQGDNIIEVLVVVFLAEGIKIWEDIKLEVAAILPKTACSRNYYYTGWKIAQACDVRDDSQAVDAGSQVVSIAVESFKGPVAFNIGSTPDGQAQ